MTILLDKFGVIVFLASKRAVRSVLAGEMKSKQDANSRGKFGEQPQVNRHQWFAE